jgi:hypothetical protein
MVGHTYRQPTLLVQEAAQAYWEKREGCSFPDLSKGMVDAPPIWSTVWRSAASPSRPRRAVGSSWSGGSGGKGHCPGRERLGLQDGVPFASNLVPLSVGGRDCTARRRYMTHRVQSFLLCRKLWRMTARTVQCRALTRGTCVIPRGIGGGNRAPVSGCSVVVVAVPAFELVISQANFLSFHPLCLAVRCLQHSLLLSGSANQPSARLIKSLI